MPLPLTPSPLLERGNTSTKNSPSPVNGEGAGGRG